MARGRQARHEPRELVFALCHEVGNLLAAARLHAHLLAPRAPGEALRDARLGVARAAVRAGALLAQVRPLLAPDTVPPLAVAPGEALRSLQQCLDAGAAARLVVDLGAARELPAVRVAPEVLNALLLDAALLALDASGGRERVRVSAQALGARVAFRVEWAAPPAPAAPGPAALCGRALALACADALLGPLGGGAVGSRAAGRERLDYRVPRASAVAGTSLRRTTAAGGSRRSQTRPSAARPRSA
jgi:hypothetical protein